MKYLVIDAWEADLGIPGLNAALTTAEVEADTPALAVIKVVPKWGDFPLETKDIKHGAYVISPDPDLVESNGIGLLVVEVKQVAQAPQTKSLSDDLISQLLPASMR